MVTKIVKIMFERRGDCVLWLNWHCRLPRKMTALECKSLVIEAIEEAGEIPEDYKINTTTAENGFWCCDISWGDSKRMRISSELPRDFRVFTRYAEDESASDPVVRGGVQLFLSYNGQDIQSGPKSYDRDSLKEAIWQCLFEE